MASDTNTKKAEAGPPLPKLDHIADLYWGGPERRITSLTLQIIGLNAIALVILMLGVLYLGEYEQNQIETKLATFRTEAAVIAASLSETTLKNTAEIDTYTAEKLALRLSQTTGQRLFIFDQKGQLILDSFDIQGAKSVTPYHVRHAPKDQLESVRVLKNIAQFVIKRLPDRQVLPLYPQGQEKQINLYPDARMALQGHITMTAWEKERDSIILSASAPLLQNNDIAGAVMVTREGQDIIRDIGNLWINILQIFGVTLIATIAISIYLSGTIARPLRKLAKAAEKMHLGHNRQIELPDLSDRNDEIGELSIALRALTHALWERMDATERFAADVAHELKNPLTSLKSAVETVGIVKKKKDREKLMEIIEHDIQRMDRLITDISSASRLDAELSRENLQKVNLRQALNHLIDIYKNPLDRQQHPSTDWDNTVETNGMHIHLTSALNKDLHVWGLEGRITQVFENLLTNAMSFSKEGQHITLRIEKQKNYAIITLDDQGPGIPDNKIETIFERFYSQRPDHEAYGHHSGLGLSICKKIIDALGGDIFASNIKDKHGTIKGARFTVILKTA